MIDQYHTELNEEVEYKREWSDHNNNISPSTFLIIKIFHIEFINLGHKNGSFTYYGVNG